MDTANGLLFKAPMVWNPLCAKVLIIFSETYQQSQRKIGHYRWNRQLFYNVFYNIDLGNRFVVHYKSIVQDFKEGGYK